MSKYFLKQTSIYELDFNGKKVLELGAGTGFLSIFLAGLGNKNLILDWKMLPYSKGEHKLKVINHN